MIESVEIQNFKCFKQLHVPDLSLVNVIGGVNNVGKTALLEALFLFHDRANPALFLNQLGWRGLDRVRVDPESMWAPYFGDLNMDKPVSIKARRDGKEEAAEYKYLPDYRPKRGNGVSGQGMPEGVSTQVIPAVGGLEMTYTTTRGQQKAVAYMDGNQPALDIASLSSGGTPTFMVTGTTRAVSEQETMKLSLVKEARRDSLVQEFLRIMVPGVKDLQVSTAQPRPSIYCDLGLPRLVPIAYGGDGVLRLLSIILEVVNAVGGLVLIDEVENGIHYSVQEKFWLGLGRAAKEMKCQVIATTHSRECLASAYKAFTGLFEPEFRYIRLDKVDGQTVAKTFSHEMLGVALDANLEVR